MKGKFLFESEEYNNLRKKFWKILWQINSVAN